MGESCKEEEQTKGGVTQKLDEKGYLMGEKTHSQRDRERQSE